ncbi:helix-turn-helix domain-containing protein [Providencia huaxiensis]|uniref:helix-turn-helix domain-containing protein n=1 Tax=Providencia huaxiensis TaxID=2027290 RepID=UPI0034E59215
MEKINDVNYHIGLFLRKKRIEIGLTGKDLGKLLNISQQQVSRYERGINSITIVFLIKYCTVLGIPLKNIMDVVYTNNESDYFQ